jgi:hypothetical protein
MIGLPVYPCLHLPFFHQAEGRRGDNKSVRLKKCGRLVEEVRP